MKAILLSTALLLSQVLPPSAQEISPVGTCDQYEVILQYLKDYHGQTVIFKGLLGTDRSDSLEVLVAGDHSFSIINKNTDGLTCIVAAGFDLTPVIAGKPA